ncbi:MAG: acyl-CoA thioesterase [Candidatus Omnitrophica bacterium]|nr:acyl-CoA thioesterase [Candidatus Omnitrophota bacterium]
MKFFDYETRVRYGETDQMGVSYYANYFVWFEAARTEYFRALGFVYTEFEKQGILLPVAEAHCRYLGPSSYDDVITVRTVVSQMRQSSIRFEYHVLKNKGPKPIATGYTVHVFSGRNFKPIRIPKTLRDQVDLASLEL